MNQEEKENNESIVYAILKNNFKIITIKKLPFIIGRNEKCDLFINNPSISKKHALIQFDEDDEESKNINKDKNIILIDNSLNGTYVNGTKITNGKKILLETGDRISFGNDKIKYIFELMNYDNDKTIVYPNMLEYNKIESNPISLVNDDYYQKSEINHLNIQLKNKSNESNFNNTNESVKITQEKEVKKNLNEEDNESKKSIKKEERKEEKKEEKKEKIENENNNEKKSNDNNKNITNTYYNIEQIFSLKNEIFELKKENENLKSEINDLKKNLENTNYNLNSLNNNTLFRTTNNKLNNNYNEISFKNVNNESNNNSLNDSNINLLAEDIRELGLFRRIKESLIPNYSELSFEELSLKFDNIIIEYKNKYNIVEILLNMETEFNNEISKFNNIISLQEEQKRDTLNKINYLINKENNLEENSYSKANKYLMEQLNELISNKENNIKLINQLKGDIIKLRTEINLYKTEYNKNIQIKNNIQNAKKIGYKSLQLNNNENIGNYNISSPEYQMKNYIDYNIDKYSIGYNYNKSKKKSKNSIEKESRNINKKYNTFNEFNLNNYENNYLNNKNYNNYNENEKENGNNDNKFLDDYQRLNLLLQNSIDNQKYKEIIKQKELIVNGMK